jgi:RNA recognition motif-containing protein
MSEGVAAPAAADPQEEARKKLVYVGNISYDTTDDSLRAAFEPFGTVVSARVVTDRGRSKGFGFVEYTTPDDANKACDVLNSTILEGRTITVNISKPRATTTASRRDYDRDSRRGSERDRYRDYDRDRDRARTGGRSRRDDY